MKHIRNYTSFIAFSLVTLILVLLLHPTISSILFPMKRQAMLDTFIHTIQNKKDIDPQEFWKFREFYYPGSLVVNKKGISMKTPYTFNSSLHPLLFTVFKSNYIESYEYLISSNDLNDVIPFNEDFTIFLDSSVAYRDRGKYVEVVFIKPVSEMIKANGFLDHKDKDKKLLEGKYWFVYTIINK